MGCLKCSRCKKEKLEEAFSFDRNHYSGRQSRCKQCQSEAQKELRASDPEKLKLAARKHRQTEKSKATRKEWLKNNRPKLAMWAVNSRKRIRFEVLKAYGNKCACCGESEEAFLAVDHVNGDGCKHRREIGIIGGAEFYFWLKKRNWPEGFQILCYNCNWAKHRRGICPHQLKKKCV